MRLWCGRVSVDAGEVLEELETLQLLQDRGSPEAKVSSQTFTRKTQSLQLEQQANMCGQSANARQGSVPADVETEERVLRFTRPA